MKWFRPEIEGPILDVHFQTTWKGESIQEENFILTIGVPNRTYSLVYVPKQIAEKTQEPRKGDWIKSFGKKLVDNKDELIIKIEEPEDFWLSRSVKRELEEPV